MHILDFRFKKSVIERTVPSSCYETVRKIRCIESVIRIKKINLASTQTVTFQKIDFTIFVYVNIFFTNVQTNRSWKIVFVQYQRNVGRIAGVNESGIFPAALTKIRNFPQRASRWVERVELSGGSKRLFPSKINMIYETTVGSK